MMFNGKELFEIKDLILNSERRNLILTHYNPDGDAIGSVLGLKHFLANRDVRAEILVPNDFPKFLKWMPEAKKIAIAEYDMKKAEMLIRNASNIFCLDFNSLSRIGALGHLVAKSNAKKILIDHHQQPDDFDFVYSDPSLPATGQMVYHFIEALGGEEYIDLKAAECLYAAIMTDTGGFRYRSSAATHRIAASLIEKGVSSEKVYSNILDSYSAQRIQLLSSVLENIEVIEGGNVAILYLKREDLLRHNFEKGDTDGFVNYGLKIRGVKMSAFFTEDLQEDLIKISFRSKEDFDVNTFSREYFEGGGHINAAGGRSLEPMGDTIERFKKNVKTHFFSKARVEN